jgi:valyl-tRNA synthetase
VIEGIRNIRGEANIKPSQTLNILFQGGGSRDRQLAQATESLFQRLAKVARIDWLDDGAVPPPNALALVGDLKVMVPLAGLIDVTAERGRLNKEIDKKSADLERIERKLANDSFVAKAPPAVVDKERGKARDLQEALHTLRDQLAGLEKL